MLSDSLRSTKLERRPGPLQSFSEPTHSRGITFRNLAPLPVLYSHERPEVPSFCWGVMKSQLETNNKRSIKNENESLQHCSSNPRLLVSSPGR